MGLAIAAGMLGVAEGTGVGEETTGIPMRASSSLSSAASLFPEAFSWLVPCSSLIPSSSEEMVTVEVSEGRIPEGATIGATGESFFALGFKTECRAAQESPDVTPRRKADFWLALLECDLWWALPMLAAEMDTVEPVIKTAPIIMAANLFFFIFSPPIVFIQGVERVRRAFRYRESGIFCLPVRL